MSSISAWRPLVWRTRRALTSTSAGGAADGSAWISRTSCAASNMPTDSRPNARRWRSPRQLLLSPSRCEHLAWVVQIRLVHCLSITYCISLNNSAYIIIIIHFDITIIAFCYFIHMYDRPKQRLYELNNYEICHYRLLLWAWTRTHHGLLQTVILKLARA